MVLNKNKKGFTLVEMLVAVAIFSIVLGVATGVFTTAMKSQRKILAQQQLLDQTSYILEYMSRSIRMARKDLNNTCAGQNLNYLLTHIDANGSHGIKFKNYKGVCQEFYLDSTSHQLKETKTGVYSDLPLTAAGSNGLTINNFKIIDSGWSQDDNLQPAVTIFLDIGGKENTKIQIQTTISQRNLDVKY